MNLFEKLHHPYFDNIPLHVRISDNGKKTRKTTPKNLRNKPVLQILNKMGINFFERVINSFESVAEASFETGIQEINISRRANGSISNAGGLKWVYSIDYRVWAVNIHKGLRV